MAYHLEKGLQDRDDDESSTDTTLLQKDMAASQYSRKSRRSWAKPLLFHGALLSMYSLGFFYAVWSLQNDLGCRKAEIIDSSATSALEYGTRVFDEIDDLDLYFGKPTPELDSRWEDLLKYQWLQVPQADMERLGRVEEGIKLPGGGYFGTLAVFHDLHCLRRVHHAFHRDHYFPNMTEDEKELDSRHAAHCLDSLRQSVQCAGDVSLLTMRWGVNTREPLGNFTSPHEEAQDRNCSFDRLTKAWLPAECPRYYETEFLQLPTAINISSWQYWEDFAATKEVTDAEMAIFAETKPQHAQTWVSTTRMHLAHCVYVLMRQADAYAAGERLDWTSKDVPHAKHCLQMLLDTAMTAPDIDTAIARGEVGFGAC
ncbi:hypothetical protein B0I35DRAFT_510442 [Stachybotrys elegans]|uniref:Uncharacterized protein n=1 Tax=Stachybotrys elegans TaxID=80388 RepID=A0A8K0SVF4_9HYPO|nr:hypothetical protein B0I35DRAFT_510442 [Stachybotrys elegans]